MSVTLDVRSVVWPGHPGEEVIHLGLRMGIGLKEAGVQEVLCDGEVAQVEAEEGPHLRTEQRWGPLQGRKGADPGGQTGEHVTVRLLPEGSAVSNAVSNVPQVKMSFAHSSQGALLEWIQHIIYVYY